MRVAKPVEKNPKYNTAINEIGSTVTGNWWVVRVVGIITIVAIKRPLEPKESLDTSGDILVIIEPIP